MGLKGTVGITVRGQRAFFEHVHLDYSFIEAIPVGISAGFTTLVNYIKQFKYIFSRKTKGYEEIGGFGTIARLFGKVWDWSRFWAMTAFLSIILAFMNVLPIPALDGGHVLFLLYEMITGRKPGDKFMEYAQIVGLVLIVMLLLYANGNDILRGCS
jgi:regulator of sigma E protease